MFYVLYIFGFDVLRFKFVRSFLLFLSIVLVLLTFLSSNLLALDLGGENHFSSDISINEDRINFGNGVSSITNEGSIASSSNNRSLINLGTNRNSFVRQVDGEMDADIRFNADGQAFIYDGGNFSGNIFGSKPSDYNGDFIVNSNLQLVGSNIRNIDLIKVDDYTRLSLIASPDSQSIARVGSLELGVDSSIILANDYFNFSKIDGTQDYSGSMTVFNDIGTLAATSIGATHALGSLNLKNSDPFALYDNVDFKVGSLNLDNSSLIASSNSSLKEVNFEGGDSVVLLVSGINIKNRPDVDHDNIFQIDYDLNVSEDSTQSEFHILNLHESSGRYNITGRVGSESQHLEIFVITDSVVDLTASKGFYVNKVYLNSYYGKLSTKLILGKGEVSANIFKDRASKCGASKCEVGVDIIEDHILRSSISVYNGVRIDKLAVKDNVGVDVLNDIAVKNIENGSQAVFKVHSDNGTKLLRVIDTSEGFTNNGIIDLASSSGSFKSDVINHRGSSFVVGTSKVDVGGGLNFEPGSIFSAAIEDDNVFGAVVADNVNISDDVILNIEIVNAHDIYKMNSEKITLIESRDKDLSSIAKITDGNIAINSSIGNRVGNVEFSTQVSNKNLLLNITRSPIESVKGSQDGIGDAIDAIGLQSSGELLALQNYLYLDSRVTNRDRINALKSLKPSNEGTSQIHINHTDSVFRSIESRISSSRIANAISDQEKGYKTVDSNGESVEEIDDSATAQVSSFATDVNLRRKSDEAWVQIINSDGKQKQKDGFDGFRSDSKSIITGYDRKVNKSLLVGASISVADSRIKSNDGLRMTQSDIVQLAIYAEKKVLRDLYLDLMVSASRASHDSSRLIPVVSRAANSKFDSSSYSVKAGIQKLYILKSGLDITPQFNLKYSKNIVDDYSESGAGALNLNVVTSDLDRLEGSLSLGLGYRRDIDRINLGFTKIETFTIYPSLKVSYDYDFIGDSQTSLSSFSGHDISFATRSSNIDRSTIKMSAGVEAYRTEDMKLNLRYIQKRRDSFVSHSGLLEVKVAF